jgi:hypothetical protein
MKSTQKSTLRNVKQDQAEQSQHSPCHHPGTADGVGSAGWSTLQASRHSGPVTTLQGRSATLQRRSKAHRGRGCVCWTANQPGASGFDPSCLILKPFSPLPAPSYTHILPALFGSSSAGWAELALRYWYLWGRGGLSRLGSELCELYWALTS